MSHKVAEKPMKATPLLVGLSSPIGSTVAGELLGGFPSLSILETCHPHLSSSIRSPVKVQPLPFSSILEGLVS